MNSSAGTNPAFSPDGSAAVPSSNHTTSGEGAQMGAITGILIASIAIMVIFCVFATIATLMTYHNPTFLARLSPDQRSLEPSTGDGQSAASEAAGAAHGVDEATLMRYPKTVYSSQAEGRGSCTTAASCCSICLADYKDAEVLRLLPDCGHAFHLKCVDPWLRLHSICPICRRASPTLPPLAGP